MRDVRLGAAALSSQASDPPGLLDAGRRAEDLGFHHVWTWDRLLPNFGYMR
jgi:alkanesulfonate monooxygenase SsuD/methylene tetrahydromethanopterin reductase-like flavin-dependent oxidoreductase (luciferase family)